MIRITRRLIQWMGEYKKRIYLGFLYAFLHGIFSALPIVIAAKALSLVLADANGTSELSGQQILSIAVMMVLSVLGRYLFAYLRSVTQDSVGYEQTANERLIIGNVFKRVSLGFFDQNNLGELTSAVTTDLSFMEMFATNMINTVVNGYITVCIIVVFIACYSVPAAIIAIIGIFLSATFLHLLEIRSRKNAPDHQKAQDDMVESTIEYLRGMPVVKSFKQEGAAIEGIRSAYRDSKKINIRIEKEYMPFNCLHLFSLKAASVGLVASAAYMLLTGQIDLPAMLMISMFSFMIFDSIEPLNNAAHVLEIIDTTLDKLASLEQAEVIDSTGHEIVLQNRDIRFEHVYFAYGTQPVLKDVNFLIPEKTTAAIVGPSGSGKTTICNLIARFYDVQSGSICIGGKDVREFTCNSLLGNISMVFQKVYLFNDTVLNNIRFGNPEATKAEVVEAAKKARCHDFIMALPDGYNTMIGEGGATLSGGEKQRISIARALLKNTPIIILDEATASIDPENEHLIQGAISELTKEKTVIVIAHRLATVEHADQILVISGGSVAERGTHEELIRQDGIYNRFIGIREKAENWQI